MPDVELKESPQLNLFQNKTIADGFAKFHHDNPRVYMLFKIFALQLLKNEPKRIGAKMIMERVRWECFTGTKDELGYKINNNYTAHYARMFIKEFPQHWQHFETRKIKSP